jgi:hypothetical protein
LSSYEGFGVFGEPGYRPVHRIYKKLTLQAMSLFADERRDELQAVVYRAIDQLMDTLKVANGKVSTIMYKCYDRSIWQILYDFNYLFENIFASTFSHSILK